MKGIIGKKLLPLLPSKGDAKEVLVVKYVAWGCSLFLFLLFVIGMVSFAVAFRSKEKTMIPNTVGLKLEDAIMMVQERALFAEIKLRNSRKPEDKGTVLSQNPGPGKYVKTGAIVTLNVSKGIEVERLDNYVGKQLSELTADLQNMSSVYSNILRIKEPVIKNFSSQPSGTIIAQRPLPGTELTELTYLELVVSKGPARSNPIAGEYVGKSFMAVLRELNDLDIPFVITTRNGTGSEIPGTIVTQSPASEKEIVYGTVLSLEMATPKIKDKEMVFGIYQKTLPSYAAPVVVRIEKKVPRSNNEPYFSCLHPGGLLTVPYIEAEGTQFVIIINETQVDTFTVQKDNL